MIAALVCFVRPLAVAALLSLLAAGLGRRILGRRPGTWEELALALPLGLAALGLAAFSLLALDLLRPGPLALATVALALFAVRGLGMLRHDLAARRQAASRTLWRLAVMVSGASAVILSALALYPPTAWDATIYHLPLARAFVEAGGFVFASHLRVPIFPLLAESLFAVLDLAGGELATQQLQVLATLATALVAAAWARTRLRHGLASAALAAAVFLGSPIVVLYAGTAYVDPLLAMFSSASLLALDRYRRSGEQRLAIVAGLLAGSAAAVKYLGLYFAAVVPVAVACTSPRSAEVRQRPVRMLAVAGVAAALALAPWYLRLLATTGNPVFPFASGIFGANEWTVVSRSATELRTSEGGVLPEGMAAVPLRLAALPRLPVDLLLARARYNRQPPFSPALLLWWPMVAVLLWRRPWSRLPLAIAGAYVLCLLPLPADSRYLLPVYPLVAVLVADALEAALELSRPARGRARTLVTLAATTLGLGLPAYAAAHAMRLGALPTDSRSREVFLERKVPGYRGIAAANARRRGETTYLLLLERLHYYAEHDAIGDFSGPARFELVLSLLDDPAALRSRLVALGADLLLLPRNAAESLPRNEVFARCFRTAYCDDEVELLEVVAPEPRGENRGGSGGRDTG